MTRFPESLNRDWRLDTLLALDSLSAMPVTYKPEIDPPQGEVVTDELVAKVVEGDLRALEELIDASIVYLNRKLWGKWASVLKRRSAWDVEAFIRDCITDSLGADLGKIRSRDSKTAGSYLVYLWKTADTRVITYKRGPEGRELATISLDAKSVPGEEGSPTRHEILGGEHSDSPFEMIARCELSEHIMHAMAAAKLSREHIVILQMWSVGHRIKQIAKILGKTQNAITLDKRRALQKLRQYLESQSFEI